MINLVEVAYITHSLIYAVCQNEWTGRWEIVEVEAGPVSNWKYSGKECEHYIDAVVMADQMEVEYVYRPN